MKWLAWAVLCALAGCVAVFALGGCSARPETHYYLLTATRESDPATPVAASAPGPRLLRVHLPGVLDRPQFVEGTGAQSVAILEYERWAEPLDQMVLSVLGQDLAADFAQRPSARASRLDVKIDTFMASQGGIARLTGSWSENPQPGEAWFGAAWRFAFSAPVDPARSTDIAAGLSMLLGQLADRIADEIAGAGPRNARNAVQSSL